MTGDEPVGGQERERDDDDARAAVREVPRGWTAALDDIDAGFDDLLGVASDVDALSIPQLHAVLERVQTHVSRSQSIRSRLAGALQRQEQANAPRGKPGAGEQEAARFLKDELQLSPGEAKRTAATGRRLASAPQARDAFERGAVSEAHAAVIARRLSELPEQHRADLEGALVELAGDLHPAALDKEAQRLIGELDIASLETAAAREKVRTQASWRRDDDGAFVGNFRLYGLQAESMEVALHAATSRRTPDDLRSDEHRRAEAFVRLAETTLRAGTLPASHGVRPQVIVLVRSEDLARRYGVATLGSGATVPLTEAGRLLADCVLTRIVLDARGVPLEGSVGSRTVPPALYKALLARDGGCSWDGCDIRAAWCQVAHGHTPHGADGRLSMDNAALLCERHHQQFDAGGWAMEIDGVTVTYRRDVTRPPVWSIVAAYQDGQRADAASSSSVAADAASSSSAAKDGAPSDPTRTVSPQGDQKSAADRAIPTRSGLRAARAERANDGDEPARRLERAPQPAALQPRLLDTTPTRGAP